jgi:pyrimidine operon attenuation protein/uracil phosphoribosyltransferase
MVRQISDTNLRRAFIRVVDDLTYEGRNIHATMKVTDEDARALAKRIVALYHAFNRKLYEGE